MNDDKDDPMHDEPLLLPDTHRTLMTAARQRTAPRLLPLRRTIGALATVAVLAGGTALAATTPWSPTVGADDRGHPTIATSTIPTDQLDALGALRRPQTDGDRTPEIEAMLKVLSADLTGGLHLSSIRVLSARPDDTTALFVAERDGNPQADLPSDVKRDVVCLFYGTHLQTVRGVLTRTPAPAASAKCGTTADLRQGRLRLGGQYAGRLELNGIVPDGVAKVTVALRTGRTIAADVRNNSFRIDTAAPDGSYEDAPIRWLDDRGAEVPKG